MGCPAKDGALWIHVLDDAGDPVPDVSVNKFFNWGTTDKKGLVKLDPLPAKTYQAEIGHPIPERFKSPYPMSKPTPVSAGQVSYVLFTLVRWATLRVKVLFEPDCPTCDAAPDEKPFTSKPVKVTWKNRSSGETKSRTDQTGDVDFGYLPAGVYDVTAEFTAKETEYELTRATATVDLEPGDAGVAKLLVVTCYTKVRFIGHCVLTIPKQLYEAGRWTAQYNGLLKDHEDVQRRVQLLGQVMNLALGAVGAADSPSVLKVMVVPECYFQGKYGAYQHEMVAILLEKLQALTGERKWKDWLFVLGTVNSLIPDAPDEMSNITPVIRGGHCYSEKKSRSDQNHLAAPYTRIIQKARFSAELISKLDWKEEPGLERDPTFDDSTGFQGTENDHRFGRYFREFFAANNEHLLADRGLDGAAWNQVKAQIPPHATERALLDVVRNLRKCTLPEDAPLGAYVFCGGSPDIENPKKFEYTAILPQWADLARRFVMAHASFTAEAWKEADVRARIKNDLIDRPGDLRPGMLPFQETALCEILNRGELPEWDGIVDRRVVLPEDFKLSWVPIVKKLFTLYIASRPGAEDWQKALLTQAPENFDYKEYSFAIPRRAGPFLGTEVDALPRSKKLVFGVEICADHANGRLKNALRSAPAPDSSVDIQLIPSCGMQPADNYIAARAGGWVFNCDGWNCSYPGKIEGGEGTFIRKELGGPGAPVESGKNPVHPHTILGKGGADGQLDAATFKPTVIDLSTMGFVHAPLFGEGPGELHVYAPLDLPQDPVFIVRVVDTAERPLPDRTFYLEPKLDKSVQKVTDLCGEIPIFPGQKRDMKLLWKDGNRFVPLKEMARDDSSLTLSVPEPTYVVRFVEVTSGVPVARPNTEVFEGRIRLMTDDNGEIPFYDDASMGNLFLGGGARPKFIPVVGHDTGALRMVFVPPAYKIRLVDKGRVARPNQLVSVEQEEERTTNKDGEIWFPKGQFGEQALFIKRDADWIRLQKVGEEGGVVLIDEDGPPAPIVPEGGMVRSGGPMLPGGPPPPTPPIRNVLPASRQAPRRGGPAPTLTPPSARPASTEGSPPVNHPGGPGDGPTDKDDKKGGS